MWRIAFLFLLTSLPSGANISATISPFILKMYLMFALLGDWRITSRFLIPRLQQAILVALVPVAVRSITFTYVARDDAWHIVNLWKFLPKRLDSAGGWINHKWVIILQIIIHTCATVDLPLLHIVCSINYQCLKILLKVGAHQNLSPFEIRDQRLAFLDSCTYMSWKSPASLPHQMCWDTHNSGLSFENIIFNLVLHKGC